MQSTGNRIFWRIVGATLQRLDHVAKSFDLIRCFCRPFGVERSTRNPKLFNDVEFSLVVVHGVPLPLVAQIVPE